ncbi:hypothetical protein CIB84_013001, partial [Bambusicola thoracicus]
MHPETVSCPLVLGCYEHKSCCNYIRPLLISSSYLTGGSLSSFLPESPAKEKVNDYDVTEPKNPAGDQPNVYTPLEGNDASFVKSKADFFEKTQEYHSTKSQSRSKFRDQPSTGKQSQHLAK